jgi:hypothetical protein
MALNLISVFINAEAVLSSSGHSQTNIFMGLISLSIVVLFVFTLLLPLTRRIKALKKERNISE